MFLGFLGAAIVGAVVALAAAYGAAQGRQLDGKVLGTQVLVGALGGVILGAIFGHLIFKDNWHSFFHVWTWVFAAIGSVLAVAALQLGYFNKLLDHGDSHKSKKSTLN